MILSQLALLRKCNPELPFHSVSDPAFRPFGRVVDFDAAALIQACQESCPMPAGGVCYERSIPALEALRSGDSVLRVLRGESDTEIGCCWGYNHRMDAPEYHRSSEHNIAVTDLVLLLAPQQAMEGFELDASCVQAFFVPAGTTVELYATTLHYAPCQANDGGFCSIVVLPRGTNAPLRYPAPADDGDGRLLFARDKWLICHNENRELIDQGAYPGIHGANYEVKY